MLRILLVFFVIIGCKTTRTGGDTKFVTLLHHDDFKRFFNGDNILMKRVHEDHWDVFYQVDDSCPASRKSANTYQILREHLEKAIKAWLAPLREIADRPIVNKLIFHKNEGHQRGEISVIFECEKGLSMAQVINRNITIRETSFNSSVWITPDLPYLASSFLHELGHAFDLADTYISTVGFFAAPSSGGPAHTIGSQPQSVMSSRGCKIENEDVLCLDDKRAIQWLYRYHYQGLELTDCPPEFVYEEVVDKGIKVGGCVYRQPLIIEARQKHLGGVLRLFNDNSDIKINDQDKLGNTALHYIATFPLEDTVRALAKFLDYPGIDFNIRNKYGNRPLHLAAGFNSHRMCYYLISDKRVKVNIRNTLKYTPLHYAARFGRVACTRHLLKYRDIEVNVQDFIVGNTPLHEAANNGHTEVVKMLLAHKDINRNIRNRAGKTARRLAELNGHEETAEVFD